MTVLTYRDGGYVCGFCGGRLRDNGDGGYSHTDAAEGFDCADASGDAGIVPWPVRVLHSIRTYPEGYALAYAEFMRKAGFHVEVER